MDSPEQVAHVPTFSSLATELKLHIFDYVRLKADQGSARLISQEWNRLMSPYMWTSFTPISTGSFTNGLLSPSEEQKACFRRVRSLTLEWNQESSAGSCSWLSRVLPLLEDNQLRAFTGAADNPLPAKLLFELLHRQAELTCFRARLDWTAAAGAIDDTAPWTTDLEHVLPLALHQVTTLRVYIGDLNAPGAHTQAFHEYEAVYNNVLVSSAPHLDRLEICGWRWQGMPNDQKVPLYGQLQHAMGASQAFRTLRQLVVADIDLSGVEDRLVQALSLDTLSVLRLEYCSQVDAFLQGLATALRQQAKTSLRILAVRTDYLRYHCKAGSLEELLQSFTGLVELECSISLAVFMDWKGNTLQRHPGLRRLLISSFMIHMGVPGWPEIVPETLAQCPQLYCFAYPPLEPGLGRVLDCSLPIKMPYGLDKSLDAVATAPSLRMIRLLWAPGQYEMEDELLRQTDEWIEKAAQIAYHFATLVLMYLYRRGSAIRLLALSAESRWKQIRSDSNLHFYPHYYYKLESTENGVNVVALRDYVAECPELADFM
ncbi:hypothetical protein HBI56_073260 [Parastagonospora nodorum]|nr:hypothetical protein HBH53_145610 [Parastagonospora nodorum]KAH4003595.1 hypothetical protein HBI10_056650 [Parastagonospora nodorum]KAH4029192.1 hypothetical protein HBI13_045680 [Parastagonospora nodorum]KAH4038091.1 hypothetical protein HBI09_062930 [Parastagonospora nodorum]KAH4054397.1 hypothetical protein HBH49_079740 [Parastagonospora nodorum]